MAGVDMKSNLLKLAAERTKQDVGVIRDNLASSYVNTRLSALIEYIEVNPKPNHELILKELDSMIDFVDSDE